MLGIKIINKKEEFLKIGESGTMSISSIEIVNDRTNINLIFDSEEERDEKLCDYLILLNSGITNEAFVTNVRNFEQEGLDSEYWFTLSLLNQCFNVEIANNIEG